MQAIAKVFLSECRRRLPIYAFTIFCLWPAISFLLAILAALQIPYHPLNLGQAVQIASGGLAIMAPDMLVVGLIALLGSLTLFSFLASFGLMDTNHRFSLINEPVILFVAVILGASLYYPSVLSQPVLSSLRIFPVWVLTLILAVIVVTYSAILALPGRQFAMMAIVLVVALLSPLPCILRNKMPREISSTPQAVLLGIDSVSLSDNLSHLERWTKEKGGTWYSKAVSPGLLTNAVWSSILLMKPVREHGVFHTFQSGPDNFGSSLVTEARKQGYYTVSVFPDQLTCWVGSDFTFDENRSGPVGWRQLATNLFENASILLPLVKPILPWFPIFSVPPNHAGSFTYSIEREFNEIFCQSSSGQPTLVVGHSTYLHVPAYPLYLDLSWEECKRVLRSPAFQLNDRSFNWQDQDQLDDVIPLRQWKLRHVQTVLTASIERSRFLERGGKMILLSDHGDRAGISSENFQEERFHNVMFATFNLPARQQDIPISTIDSGSLLGLVQRAPFDPVVEFALGEPSEWPPLVHSAQLAWNGRVYLNQKLLTVIFERLQGHRPWENLADTKSFAKHPMVPTK